MSSDYRNEVLRDGPVAYWRLGERSGTTAVDETSNGYDGTYTGNPILGEPGVIVGDTDTAVDFDGDDYVDAGDVIDPQMGSFAAEAWIKVDNVDTTSQRIAQKDTGTSGWGLSIGDPGTGGRIRFFIRGASTVSLDTGTGVISSGSWHHVVAVYNASTGDRIIYVDGSQVASDVIDTGGFVDNSANLLSSGDSYDGDTDEFAIYDKALSATRIQKHYEVALAPNKITSDPFAEVVILDENGAPVTIVSDYEEWQVSERYYGVSSFRLEVDDDAVGADEINKGRFLYERGAKLVFRIEQLDREEVYDAGDYRSFMICTGPAVGLLDDRIAIPPAGSAYDKISAVAGETAIMHYVRGHCAENASAARAVPSFGTAVDQGRGATVSKRARYQPISELIHEIGIISGLGWQTVYRQGESPPFVFEAIEGTDRSGEVFIEPSMDAVDEQALLDSILGKKTFALVAGQGEGDSRTKEEVWTGASEPSGWDRREVFVDARDLDDDEAAEGALTDRGNEKLEETQPGASFTVEAAAFGEFIYGRDWFLGDILMIRNRNWNVEQSMRVISVTTSRSGPEVSIDVEFDRPWPTVKDRIREAFSGGTSPGTGAVDYPTDYVSATSGGKYTETVEFHNDFKTIGPDDAVGYFRTATGSAGITRIGARQAGDTSDRVTLKLNPSNSVIQTVGANFYVTDGNLYVESLSSSSHTRLMTTELRQNYGGALTTRLRAYSSARSIWYCYDDAGNYHYIDFDRGHNSGAGRVRFVGTGNVRIDNDLNVYGSKNAEIPDPNDPTIGYRFAAIEADEPGILMKRVTITVPDGSDRESLALPSQWARIAKDGDAMATPLSGDAETQVEGRAWPRAYVDLAVPEVRVVAPPGDYRVWIMASRADDAVADWQHVIDIPQEEEDI